MWLCWILCVSDFVFSSFDSEQVWVSILPGWVGALFVCITLVWVLVGLLSGLLI